VSAADIALIDRLSSTGKPVVAVLITGRPLILTPILDKVAALVVAWLPGTEGAGVADVLYGDFCPTGKLPHSWPRTMAQIPINVGDTNYDPLFPYGFGLSWPPRSVAEPAPNPAVTEAAGSAGVSGIAGAAGGAP
jgi:beta-glucosidase